jgi:hypothetical protein
MEDTGLSSGTNVTGIDRVAVAAPRRTTSFAGPGKRKTGGSRGGAARQARGRGRNEMIGIGAGGGGLPSSPRIPIYARGARMDLSRRESTMPGTVRSPRADARRAAPGWSRPPGKGEGWERSGRVRGEVAGVPPATSHPGLRFAPALGFPGSGIPGSRRNAAGVRASNARSAIDRTNAALLLPHAGVGRTPPPRRSERRMRPGFAVGTSGGYCA